MRPYRNWLATFLWMGVIFFLSSRPADELPSFGLYDLLLKKSGHLSGYAILGWLFLRSWESLGIHTQRAQMLALLSSVLYAITDEFHQSFVPGRHASVIDVLIDTAGIALGVFAFGLLKHKWQWMSNGPFPSQRS
ncbi:MAG: VanZ family protein [Anaerolineales bacterium]